VNEHDGLSNFAGLTLGVVELTIFVGTFFQAGGAAFFPEGGGPNSNR
jgi:hypothetical protein